jgi:hypothetical protein
MSANVQRPWKSSAFITTLLAPALFAQQAGTVNGLLSDPSGSPIAGAKVTLIAPATRMSRAVTTGQDGLYHFSDIDAGDYNLTAEAAGFKEVIAHVRVEVAQVARLDLSMQLGSVNERIEVTAITPTLQTADSQVGGVVENKAITDMPLNGRNFTQLMLLMTGASEAVNGNNIQGIYNQRPGGAAFTVNGQRTFHNEYLIDGLDDKEIQSGASTVDPIIDALQEFRVQSSNYSAEFGSEAGGQINAVIKSGTNEFHGSVWEFFRNNDLDSNNFFNNLSGVPIAEFRRNQFGVSGGGPVLLPKYNGRNRTFIFGAYEGTRIVKGVTQLTTVPTAAQRAGNFSGTAAPNDPLTGAPFPGGIIPASRINSITSTILQRWVPLPNNSGVFNWISNFPQTDGNEQYNWRIDHRVSEKDSIFGHYLYEDNDFHFPNLFPTDGSSVKTRGQNLLLAWTHLFGASTLNEFRAGFGRYRMHEYQIRQGKENVLQELGIQGLCQLPSCWGIPIMSVTGFGAFGEHGGQPSSSPRGFRNDLFQWQDNLYKTIGSHSLKTGIAVKWHRDTFIEAITSRGSYTFNGFLTGVPFADYLLGEPKQISTSPDVFDPNFRNVVVQPWFQDDWRVSKTLTVNLGMRWEWNGRPTSANTSVSTILYQNGAATLVTARNPGSLPASLVYENYNNFGPRAGFAWNPQFGHGRTVFRGAYGIFYQREIANTWVFTAINPPFIITNAITLDTTPGSPTNWQNFSLTRPTALAMPGSLQVYALDPHWKDTSVQQWNFNVQQLIGYNLVLQAAYLGNHDTHLPRETFPNEPIPGPGPVQTRRPYQNFGNIIGLDSGGDSNYHSLQIELEKRYSNGLQLVSAYTFSKCIDNTPGTLISEGGSPVVQNPRNFRSNRGRCGQDARQRYSLSFVYDIPFGRGRKLGTGISHTADLIAGGWQVTGIATFRTGQPFTSTAPTDVANVADTATWPNAIGNPNSVGNRSIYHFFNTAAFIAPPIYTFGNEGRNVIVGPGVNNWDLALFKAFRFDEKRQLQFRTEFFNAFNHSQFAPPGAVFGTAQFGQISAISHDPRDVQMSLKFLW